MDTKSFTTQESVISGKSASRLPAGSTLLINGIHVPHPHAEVNLAGEGDPRLGETEAVTEFAHETKDESGVVRAELKKVPLADEVKTRGVGQSLEHRGL